MPVEILIFVNGEMHDGTATKELNRYVNMGYKIVSHVVSPENEEHYEEHYYTLAR